MKKKLVIRWDSISGVALAVERVIWNGPQTDKIAEETEECFE